MFKTISKNTTAEIVEKKSKFIANIFYIESEEEAEEIIKNIRKRYYDARHNCFAYKINKDNISRFSDDGEPSGTAGAPLLNIIEGKGLSNILIIVTRYFGGILLGTGGLVRAYTESAISALENAEIVNKVYGKVATLEVDYKFLDSVKYYLKNENISISNIEYKDTIFIEIEVIDEDIEKLNKQLKEKNLNIKKIAIITEKYIIKNS